MMTVQQFLDVHNVPYETEGRYCREGWLQLQCPFCGGGRDADKPYMGIPVEGNTANCWQCGKHNIIITLAKFTSLSIGEIKNTLGKTYGNWAKPEHTGNLIIPDGVTILQYAHINYLKQRGFIPEQLERIWGIGAYGMFPVEWHWRIFIPIDHNGSRVSWTTRSIADDIPDRYKSASPEQESVPHKSLLYGEDYCRNSIVVVEGPLDAWAIGPGAVATFGTGVTDAQILKMIKYPRVGICFDSEPKAQEAAYKLYNRLRPLIKSSIAFITLESGKDPADCLKTDRGRTELARVRKIFLEGVDESTW